MRGSSIAALVTALAGFAAAGGTEPTEQAEPLPSAGLPVEDAAVIVTDRGVLSALGPSWTLAAVLGGDSSPAGSARLADNLRVLAEAVRDGQGAAGGAVTRAPVAGAAQFDLVGLVNRLDRAPRGGACGEVRAVYRLRVRDLRLPMTLAAAFSQPSADCGAQARRWLRAGASSRGALAALLSSDAGPLAGLGPARALELNLQLERTTAGAQPRTGWRARYLLRAFAWSAGRLVPAPLENTPAGEAAAGLAAWLESGGHRAGLLDGSQAIPAELSASSAVSVHPRPETHFENQPFTTALARAEPALDRLSCAGCHAEGTVAGFHLLGEDAKGPFGLADPLSAHLRAELGWRKRLVEAVADGRPRPARPDGPGAPAPTASTGPARIGDACERSSQCPGEALCEQERLGFPRGMCSAGCEAVEAGAVCGALPEMYAWSACRRRGEPAVECLRKSALPSSLRACDRRRACRPDYVCAWMPGGEAGCVPPYFLPQLALDGAPAGLWATPPSP